MGDEPHHLIVAVAARPHPNEEISGDGWAVHWHQNACRIALIDGLGHGPDAAAAADRARSVLDASPAMPPVEAIRQCHDALGATRGAAMAVVTIDAQSPAYQYSAVGNVEAQFWNGERIRRPITHRGIVGRSLPTVRGESVSIDATDWVFLLYSDGIRDRFALETMPEFVERDAQALADRILCDWSRDTDDATVIVVMPRITHEDSGD